MKLLTSGGTKYAGTSPAMGNKNNCNENNSNMNVKTFQVFRTSFFAVQV